MKIQHVDSLGRNNPFQPGGNPRTRHHLTKGSFVQRYPCQAVCTACHQFFAILDISCEQKSILEMTGRVQRMRPQAAGLLQDWARELVFLRLGGAKVFHQRNTFHQFWSTNFDPSSVSYSSTTNGMKHHIVLQKHIYIYIVSYQILQILKCWVPPAWKPEACKLLSKISMCCTSCGPFSLHSHSWQDPSWLQVAYCPPHPEIRVWACWTKGIHDWKIRDPSSKASYWKPSDYQGNSSTYDMWHVHIWQLFALQKKTCNPKWKLTNQPYAKRW